MDVTVCSSLNSATTMFIACQTACLVSGILTNLHLPLSHPWVGDERRTFFMANFFPQVRLTILVPEDSEEPYALWCVFGDHPPFAAFLGLLVGWTLASFFLRVHPHFGSLVKRDSSQYSLVFKCIMVLW